MDKPFQENYRPDIDGLRAIAAGIVVLYHAFPTLFPGGFVGVDVFFVISGYLITGILLRDIRAGGLRIATFYRRRVRRIFPALTVVLVACLAFGEFALYQDEYEQLGKHALAAATFVSNVVFWREAGYFDTAAELKPLLHLWSLGVEEQFYIVWPLLLAVLIRWRISVVHGAIAVTLASFAVGLMLVSSHQVAAFFLPFGRAWELTLGGLLACAAATPNVQERMNAYPRLQRAAGWAGLALIAAAVAVLDGRSRFPGAWALLPVLGACCIIWASERSGANRVILASRPFVFVGLISYPLYLWHWPLLSFLRILEDDTQPARVGAVAASLLLAWLTYRYVELPVRRGLGPVFLPRRTVPALCTALAACGAVGLAANRDFLVPISAGHAHVTAAVEAAHDWSYQGDRVIAGREPGSVLFFGDSHMQQYFPRIESLAKRGVIGKSVVFKTEGGCVPLPGIERSSQPCLAFVEEGFRLAARADTVVIAASWAGLPEKTDYYWAKDGRPFDARSGDLDAALKGFGERLAALKRAGKRVIVVTSSPRGPEFDPKHMVLRDRLQFEWRPARVERASLVEVTRAVDERLRAAVLAAGAEIVDPLEYLCAATCANVVDGKPVFMDTSHIRASYVKDRVTYLDAYLQ